MGLPPASNVMQTIHLSHTGLSVRRYPWKFMCFTITRGVCVDTTTVLTNTHLMSALHFSVVMSFWRAIQPGIGLIGAKSMPTTRLDIGMFSLHTCRKPHALRSSRFFTYRMRIFPRKISGICRYP
jgi:hypothetical protein